MCNLVVLVPGSHVLGGGGGGGGVVILPYPYLQMWTQLISSSNKNMK